MKLDQDISLNINPQKSSSFIKFGVFGITTVITVIGLFFSIKTFILLTRPLPSVPAAQIININQIDQAISLINEKTVDFSGSGSN